MKKFCAPLANKIIFMRFSYTAVNQENKIQKGFLEAASLQEASEMLISDGWYIRKIRPAGRGHSFLLFSFSYIPLMEKVLFVKHLQTMLKSGISLNEALEVIAAQTSSANFKRVVLNILERVKAGQSLSSALASNKRFFDPLFVNIVRVGEESGTLEENLRNLGNELEGRIELGRKIRAAAFYPSIVLFMTFGMGLVLAYFVLPKIRRLFESLNFDMPLSTKILLWLADVFDKYGLLIVLAMILSAILLWFLATRRFTKPFSHWFLIKMPILGRIVIHYNLAMINRILGTMLKSGLTIDQALTITSETTKNFVYKRRLELALPEIQHGKQLSDVLAGFRQSKRHPLFPLLVIKMISVGERSGRLDESFAYVAEYFEKEVDNATKNLATVIEPLLLVFVGLVVGFLAVSVITPIYQITSKFRR